MSAKCKHLKDPLPPNTLTSYLNSPLVVVLVLFLQYNLLMWLDVYWIYWWVIGSIGSSPPGIDRTAYHIIVAQFITTSTTTYTTTTTYRNPNLLAH